jgi:cytidylate kinase
MRQMSKPVVTISSTYGAGGTVVGPAVARRLDLPYLDRILSSDLARRAAVAGCDEEQLSEDERSEGLMRRVLDSLASVPALFGSVITPLEEGVLTEERVWEQVEASIVQMADETGGVVVGRGATCVLRKHGGAFHVRLDGPRRRRIAQAMQIEGIGEAEARRRQATIDRTRELYLKRFYDADPTDPRLYHLVLDSTAIPLDVCADLVVQAARALWDQEARA